jgi:hypothetical protein
MNSFDLNKLRAENLIPELLARRGHDLNRSGTRGFRGPCPIHKGGNKTAFSVQSDGRGFCCHSCGKKGDVIDLVMALDGLSFPAACEVLGALRIYTQSSGSSSSCTSWAASASAQFRKPQLSLRASPEPQPDLPELGIGKRTEIDRITDRLRGDVILQASIAASRGWDISTITALCHPNSTTPYGAVGWMDECPKGGPAVCFVFPHAVKLRKVWPDETAPGGLRWHLPKGDKVVFWLWSGWPWNSAELWREDRFETSPIIRDSCLLMEGEPDAISAIDDYLETTFRAVVAIPSATIGPILRKRLPHILRGRTVGFMADTDTAGQKAAKTMTAVLRGSAKSLKILSPIMAA